ncbi:DnaD domain protein [Macrococcoides caseolyticum]|uniref:DnaD domain protein n=1 Tax=Macrococcoides caseolyticum TaxID=69966 RepID=UPI0011AF8432|nr:DnaD domain protein [Macrococcus caseolyticus]QPT47127.1 DnaD domain protein [Macrococcus caseolyticus]
MHRSITDHWLYLEDRKFSRYEAWLDLLLEANYEDKKVLVDGTLTTIERGSKLTSLRKLSNKWKWSITKVDSFLKALESDEMIILKKDTKKTVVTIVNYDFFQNVDLEKRHKKNTENTQKENEKETEKNQKETNNKLNKLNNINNVVIEPNPKNDFAEVIQLYQSDIQATPPLTVINKLSDDFDMFGKEIMLYAIKKSALAGNRDYRFIDYLTKEWRKQQLKTLEAVEQFEDKRNQPKQSYSYNNDRNAVPNKFGDRPDLSFQALEIKKGKGGLASFTDEERKAYESYYL